MGIQPKMFHRNSETARRRLLLSWWNTGSAQLHRGSWGSSVKNHLSDPRKLKSWRAPKWWAFLGKGDSGFKIWAIHFWYCILDFMRVHSSPWKPFKEMDGLAWKIPFLLVSMPVFWVVVIPLFSWRDSARIPGTVDLKVDLKGGSYRSHVPKQDSCFFWFSAIWKYLDLFC